MIAAARDQEVCALQLLLGLGRQDGAEKNHFEMWKILHIHQCGRVSYPIPIYSFHSAVIC